MSRISAVDFRAGLITALCATGRTEFALDASFHQAFMKIVQRVQKDRTVEVEGIYTIKMDPMFGKVDVANLMILEAEADQVVSCAEHKCTFLLDQKTARKELQAQEPALLYWYLTLAKFFDHHLQKESM